MDSPGPGQQPRLEKEKWKSICEGIDYDSEIKDQINLSDPDLSERTVNSYIIWWMRMYENCPFDNMKDKELWEEFQEEFQEWTALIWKKGSTALMALFSNYLRDRGVHIKEAKKGRSYTALFTALCQEQEPSKPLSIKPALSASPAILQPQSQPKAPRQPSAYIPPKPRDCAKCL